VDFLSLFYFMVSVSDRDSGVVPSESEERN
jgi:hypothetical protein